MMAFVMADRFFQSALARSHRNRNKASKSRESPHISKFYF